jgi:hypothetical protein
MGGAAIMANVILGEELGLYRAMADGKQVMPARGSTWRAEPQHGAHACKRTYLDSRCRASTATRIVARYSKPRLS